MDGLCSLIIPQTDDATVADIMATETAQRLVDKGASLYFTRDGRNVLSIKRPEGAFCKAWGMGGRGLEAPCVA